MDIKTAIPIVVQISLMLIVASIGLQARWGDLIYALRRPALMVRGIVAVYLVVPLVALLVVSVLPIQPLVKAGIVAMALSPLAPFVPGKMLKAGAETSFVVGVYVALLVLGVIVVPLSLLVIGLFIPRAVFLDASSLASFVALSVLLPLLLGILLGGIFPKAAPLLSRIASICGNVVLLVIALPVFFLARHQFAGLIGDGAVLAMGITVLAGLAAGHILGGRNIHHRVALAQAAATRHPGIAGLIIHGNLRDPRAMLAALLFLLVGIVVSAIYMKWANARIHAMDGVLPSTVPLQGVEPAGGRGFHR